VLKSFLVGVSTLFIAGIGTQVHAEDLIVSAEIDRFCEGNFLPDAQVEEVEERAKRWAENRRFIVRHSDDVATLKIIPPSHLTDRSADSLIREMVYFFGILNAPCPTGATQLPLMVGVEGLDVDQDGMIISPR